MEMGIFLAFIGIAIMLIFSNAGSCIGTSIAGSATIGALKKREEIFGSCLVLCALPATHGLYGFGGFYIFKPYLTGSLTMFQGAAILGAGLALGIVCFFSALWQAKMIANIMSSMANGQDVFGKGLILAVFPELYAIVAFAATFLIQQLFVAV
jgi:V/A-type H+-transporting ATPase subunit K